MDVAPWCFKWVDWMGLDGGPCYNCYEGESSFVDTQSLKSICHKKQGNLSNKIVSRKRRRKCNGWINDAPIDLWIVERPQKWHWLGVLASVDSWLAWKHSCVQRLEPPERKHLWSISETWVVDLQQFLRASLAGSLMLWLASLRFWGRSYHSLQKVSMTRGNIMTLANS